MKKGIAMIIAVVMLLSAAQASAAGENTKAAFELQSYGILIPGEDGDFALTREVTRAEFAAMVVRTLDMEDVAQTMAYEARYRDVPQSEWFAGYVNLLSSLGMVNGAGDGMFQPLDTVSLPEAAKIMISCLGYGAVANSAGGYPDGFMSYAAQLGLLKNVGAAGTMTRADAVQLIYNALDVKTMQAAFGVEGAIEYNVSDNDTLRGRFENRVKSTGIVTANFESYLVLPVQGLQKDEIVIDDTIYKMNGLEASSLLGQKVEFYCQEDEDTGKNHLISIRAAKDNEILEVDGEDISSLTETQLQYLQEGRGNVTEKIQSGAALLRNGRPLTRPQKEDFNIANGSVKLIDNDGDNIYDVVMMEDYEAVRVDRVSGDSIYLKDDFGKEKKRSLLLDENDKEMTFSICMADGTAVKTEDLKADDMLSIASSVDGQLVRIVVSRDVAEGTLTEIGEDTISIDGTSYKTLETEIKAEPGDDIQAYLDFRGKVVKTEKMKNARRQFGYVLECGGSGMSLGQIKILEPGDFREEMVSNKDENNPVETAVLRGRNKQVKVLDLAGKVNVNGSNMSLSELQNYFGEPHKGILNNKRVIRYTLNAEGKVNTISQPERIYDPVRGVDKNKTYNSYEKTFGSSGNTPFGANEQTKVLCIPDNKGVKSEEDYLATIDLNNGSTYVVSGFDIDEETSVADLIVITTTLDAAATGVINDKSEFAVVAGMKMRADEKTGDSVTVISMWSEGILQSRTPAEIDEVKNAAANLKFGDVIYYSEDSDKNLNKIQRIGRLRPSPGLYSDGSASNERTVFGQVDSIKFNQIDDVLNRRVDIVTAWVAEDQGASAEILLNCRNPIPLYLIDNQLEEITKIETEDIRQGDKIFAHIVNYKLRCAVVVRD